MDNKDNLSNDRELNENDEIKQNIEHLKENDELENYGNTVNLIGNSDNRDYKKITIILIICLAFVAIMSVLNTTTLKKSLDKNAETDFNQILINGKNNYYDTSSDYSETVVGTPAVKVEKIEIVDLKIIESKGSVLDSYSSFYVYCKFKNNSEKPLSYITMNLNIEGKEAMLSSDAIVNSGETTELVSDLILHEKGITVNDLANCFLVSARYSIKEKNQWTTVSYSHDKNEYTITTRKNSINSTASTPSVKVEDIYTVGLDIKKEYPSYSISHSSIKLKIKNDSNRAIKDVKLKYYIDGETEYLYHDEVIEAGHTSKEISSIFGFYGEDYDYSKYRLEEIEYIIEEDERLVEVTYNAIKDEYSISMKSAYEAEDKDYFLN